ncbi:P-loop containing nucleoside triphosphate hydrolase protein [Hyphopichia burtonii NRRL Y-1933]|uniref:p-loop containing nucleoside triphosphate hydrolase protein n=1 Tax=Hyphopichia burtonii NRRL Y-1933 TaxID=984485 RepID=A0A1E4RQI0_9ASCO|nr:P-loop containing nucleoside triphosphate hydrolase protein [Hyphopichia burtonii NRRL Y-1933]ODV69532.1 P-loop containing nucleoside triphosphate hydrolase protein [Hyphopichia burtonii NRRL Y-1933]
MLNTPTHTRNQSASTPTLKVVLLGDLGVGKTCLRSQFVHHIFTNAYKTTIGGDYLTTSVYLPTDGAESTPTSTIVTQPGIDNENYLDLDESSTMNPRNRYSNQHSNNNNDNLTEKVNLQIWDTAGQERFNSISQAFYRGTDVVVLVYDITNYESVLSLSDWFRRFLDHCHVDNPGVMIIGNKQDKANERCIELDEIQEILNKNSHSKFNDFVEDWDIDLREVTSKRLDLVDDLFLRVARLGLDRLNNDSNNSKLKGRKRSMLRFDNIDLTDINHSSSRCAC